MTHIYIYPAAWRPTPPPRCSQVALRIHFHWILGSLVVLDLFLLCCMMQRTQEQITFLAGVKGAKMIPRDFKTQEKWTQPGWFEDSFSLNFALPGHHFGGPQGCQNDAQGTQKGAKMMPGEPKSQGKWPPGAPKGDQWEKDRKNIENVTSRTPCILTDFRSKMRKNQKVIVFLKTWSRQTGALEISWKPGSPEPWKCE